MTLVAERPYLDVGAIQVTRLRAGGFHTIVEENELEPEDREQLEDVVRGCYSHEYQVFAHPSGKTIIYEIFLPHGVGPADDYNDETLDTMTAEVDRMVAADPAAFDFDASSLVPSFDDLP